MSQILTQSQVQPGLVSHPVGVTAHNMVSVMDKPLQHIPQAIPINLEETIEVITVDNPEPADIPCFSVCQDASLSSSLCSSLSPMAEIFTPLLYPPGVDKFGRPVFTEENASMQLNYFDVSDTGNEEPAVAATPDLKDVKKLATFRIKLPDGEDFIDRVLPASGTTFTFNDVFSSAYYFDLHEKVKLGGTYNFAGSRITLKHCKINVDKFRKLLEDYEDMEILQFLSYGFPLGLAQDFQLSSCLQNHSSAH